jgi:uncharacterized protein (DUF927 family)
MLDDTNNNVIDSINTISANALPSESNKIEVATQVESVSENVPDVSQFHAEREQIFYKKFPVSEDELLSMPYELIKDYFKPLYYEIEEGTRRITDKKTDYVLGMTTRLGAVSKFVPSDIELSPFVITAYVKNEVGRNFGFLIKFTDQSMTVQFIYLRASDIEENRYIKILQDSGFFIVDDSDVRVKFKKYLNRAVTTIPYVVPYIDKLGYSETHHGFFMPDGLYLADAKKYAWFDNLGEQVIPAGTYEAWQENIARIAVKYPITTFAMCCAFGAYLMQILGERTVFFHFHGRGSKGKTTLLQIATSVHANGADPSDDSFIQSWHSTNAGLETLARVFDGGMGAFDELHTCDEKQFANSIYTICNGTSKVRATGNGNAQQKHAWRFLALSSGEMSGFDKLSKNNTKDATLGRAVRFADIPVTGEIFTTFEGDEIDTKEGGVLASKLKKECALNFGHAGRKFIQELLKLGDSKKPIQEMLEKDVQEMFDKLTAGKDLGAAELRLMKHFAIIAVAGNYAVMFDILPMTEQRVFDAVVHVRDLWLSEMEHFHQQKAKKEDYAHMLKSWLFKNMTKFQPLTDHTPKSGCKGYYKMLALGQKSNVYLIRSEAFDEIFGNQKLADVCAELIKKGILIPSLDQDGEIKRNQQSHRVSSIMGNNGQAASIWLYAIDSTLLDDSDGKDTDDDAESMASNLTMQQMSGMMAQMQAMMSAMSSK